MSQYRTMYKTENGKTRKVKEAAAKGAGKNGAQGYSGAAGKTNPPEEAAKQGA